MRAEELSLHSLGKKITDQAIKYGLIRFQLLILKRTRISKVAIYGIVAAVRNLVAGK